MILVLILHQGKCTAKNKELLYKDFLMGMIFNKE